MPGADVILDALGLIVRELALFAATGILIGGLNDLAVDCLWFAGRGKQLLSSGRTQLPALDRLPAPKRTGPMAVMIPAWDEAAVIAPMLAHSLKIFAGENVHIFVGCYPNDPLTIDEIRFFADTHPRIELALCPGNGPTTKADCLNAIWRTLENAEHRRGKRFKAIILHDAEDIVHRGEIALFDRLIEGHALVQVPVRPLPDRRSRWIANHNSKMAA